MNFLIAHLLGDYVFQNQWMADNKTKAWLPCAVHVTIYGLIFYVVIQPSALALSIIMGTHCLIDRYRLAKYWMEWYGNGCPGKIWSIAYAVAGKRNTTPPWLEFILLVLVDNTFHLVINYYSTKLL